MTGVRYGIPLGNLHVNLTGSAEGFIRMLKASERAVMGWRYKVSAHQASIFGVNVRIAKIQRGIASIANGLSTFGNTLTQTVTLPLAAMGAGAIYAFAQFDYAMQRSMSNIRGLTDENKKAMTELAITLSDDSVHSATALAAAYGALASAGLDAEHSMANLPTVMKFANVSNLDMVKSTRLLMSAQQAMGLRSTNAADDLAGLTRVANALVRADQAALGTVEEFSEALSLRFSGALGTARKSLEEGMGLLMALASKGIRGRGAGEAATMFLRDIGNAQLKAAKEWKAKGISLYDDDHKMLPLWQVLGQLEIAFASLSDKERVATRNLLGFTQRSFYTTEMLMGMSEAMYDFETTATHAGNALEIMNQARMKPLIAQLQIMWNRIVNVAIDIGERLSPAITWLNEFLASLTKQWRNLSEDHKNFIVTLLVVAAVIGPTSIALGMLAASLLAVGAAAVFVYANPLVLLVSALLAGAAASFILGWALSDLAIDGKKSFTYAMVDMILNLRLFGHTLKITILTTLLRWDMMALEMEYAFNKSLDGMLHTTLTTVEAILRAMALIPGGVFGWAAADGIEKLEGMRGIRHAETQKKLNEEIIARGEEIHMLLYNDKPKNGDVKSTDNPIQQHSIRRPGELDNDESDGFYGAKGMFKETSLRRMNLDALASEGTQKQEVRDEAVVDKLDEVIDTIKKYNRSPTIR